MGIKNSITISPLTCIQPTNGIEICPIDTVTHHSTKAVEQPLFSHETTLVTIAPGIIEDLFVHHYQTDQLLVVQGKTILVILQNRQYQYIVMKASQPTIVTVPPGIPHGAINLTNQPCIAINSIIRHGPAHDRDYRPMKHPFPYDLEAVKQLLAED